jgi:hypothetical protein
MMTGESSEDVTEGEKEMAARRALDVDALLGGNEIEVLLAARSGWAMTSPTSCTACGPVGWMVRSRMDSARASSSALSLLCRSWSLLCGLVRRRRWLTCGGPR